MPFLSGKNSDLNSHQHCKKKSIKLPRRKCYKGQEHNGTSMSCHSNMENMNDSGRDLFDNSPLLKPPTSYCSDIRCTAQAVQIPGSKQMISIIYYQHITAERLGGLWISHPITLPRGYRKDEKNSPCVVHSPCPVGVIRRYHTSKRWQKYFMRYINKHKLFIKRIWRVDKTADALCMTESLHYGCLREKVQSTLIVIDKGLMCVLYKGNGYTMLKNMTF